MQNDYISREEVLDIAAEESTDWLYRAIKELPAADVVERPMWISVEDELPELFDAVLISISTKNGFDQPTTIETIGCYEHGEWCSFTGRICEGERVTHWQPLPAPPKEVTVC